MKFYKLCIAPLLFSTLFSCNTKKTDNKQHSSNTDTLVSTPNKVVYDDTRENLKLSVSDTIRISASYFFSNLQTKDLFLLKIAPGMVKNSRAELQIITAENKVIYVQTFDAFYCIRDIFQPDTTPASGGQVAYETYLHNYWKSITAKQYEDYFRRSVDSFFTNIYPIERDKLENVYAWKENMNDTAFGNEILKDSSIKLLDVICFDCDEGGAVIGYSRIQNKVVTLIEHD
jgi:hypothetical protein